MAFDQFRGRLLSFNTASQETEICVSQLHRLIAAGHIAATKLGYKMTRIDGDSLADFLTKRLTEPRPPRGKYAKAKTSELAGQA